MRRISACAAVVALLAVTAAACSKAKDSGPPVAAPSVTLSSTDVPIGSAVDVTYAFTVPQNAPAIGDDDVVFVHFVDKDGELLWTDDHAPMPSTRDWKPGMAIKYTRTVFVPKFSSKTPYVGETHVDVGLYSPKTGQRLAMTGTDVGMRSYRVASFTLRPRTDNTFVIFQSGWHNTEIGAPGSGVEWQWSRKMATLRFRNPRRDAVFFLDCDQPVAVLGAPQHVTVQIGPNTVDEFDLTPNHRELRRISLTPAQLGDADTIDMVVNVDRTFVPASLPQLKSSDSRELGIRVFRVSLQPK